MPIRQSTMLTALRAARAWQFAFDSLAQTIQSYQTEWTQGKNSDQILAELFATPIKMFEPEPRLQAFLLTQEAHYREHATENDQRRAALREAREAGREAGRFAPGFQPTPTPEPYPCLSPGDARGLSHETPQADAPAQQPQADAEAPPPLLFPLPRTRAHAEPEPWKKPSPIDLF